MSFTVEAIADICIREDLPTSPGGSGSYLYVFKDNTGSDILTILKWDLTAYTTATDYVRDATLEITFYDSDETVWPISLKYTRCTRDWTEATATWNTYDGTNPWTTPGGDYDDTFAIERTITTNHNIIDITALVRDAVLNRSQILNLGINFNRPPSNEFNVKIFSRDNVSLVAPKLTVALGMEDWQEKIRLSSICTPTIALKSSIQE